MKIIKIIISLSLIVMIIHIIDLESVISIISKMSISSWLITVGFVIINNILAYIRWYLILNCLNACIHWRKTINLFFIGLSLNQFLPTSVVGDLFKIWKIKKLTSSIELGLISIIIDRLFPLMNLIIILSINLFWLLQVFDIKIQQFNTIIMVFTVILIIIFMTGFILINKFINSSKIYKYLELFKKNATLFYNNKRKIYIAFFIGFFIFFIKCISIFYIAKFLMIEITFMNTILIFPLIFLITAIPISISGWGIREGLMIILLNYININQEQAVSLSIVVGLAYLVANLPALLLLLRNKKI